MSRSQRDKGNRAEREVVALLKKAGLNAKRVPLSGAAEGFKGDVLITLPPAYAGRELKAEVKVRADGFKQMYLWLGGNDLLFVRADRRRWLVIQDLDSWIKEKA